MNSSPDPKKGLLSGLIRVLHLHQLPQSETKDKNAGSNAPTPPSIPGEIAPISSAERVSIQTRPPAPTQSPGRTPVVPLSPSVARSNVGVSTTGNTTPKAWPASSNAAQRRPVHVGKGFIITDYDRILELVRTHTTIKLDEIARLLSLKEELVAQELQTLEDNGLVEVKYPAFGEPLIYYKTPEA